MSEHSHDDDIEFDFFDDVDTKERPPEERVREPGPPGPPPPRQPRPPGRLGLTPRGRLVVLIAFAVLVVVLLVLLIVSCTGESTASRYEGYMTEMQAVAKDSQQIGRNLDKALTEPGIKPNELATKIDGLADQQQQGITAAEAIDAPGALQQEQQEALEALRFRLNGMRRLADAFRTTAGSEDASGASLVLANQALRLVSSDVVWQDLFRAASLAQLREDGVSGVPVPESDFVQSPGFGTPDYWQPIFERVSGAATSTTPTGGGLHGTGIVETKAEPSGIVLSTDQQNIVTAGTDLAFAVTIENTGDNQEVRVKVTLTIQQQPSPIVATRTIDSINPAEQKTVTFSNLGQVTFATETTVKVDVAPVPDEARTENNSAEYPVIFSLG